MTKREATALVVGDYHRTYPTSRDWSVEKIIKHVRTHDTIEDLRYFPQGDAALLVAYRLVLAA